MMRKTSLTTYDSGTLSQTALDILKTSKTVTATHKNYVSHYRVFERWLKHKGVHSTPTHIDLINFFADQFTGKLVKVSPRTGKLINGNPIAATSIDARRWGILKVLNSKGVTFSQDELNALSQYISQLKLSAEQQETKRRRGQAAPLRWAAVKKMLNCAVMNSGTRFKVMRDKALLCFMAVSGCRESEACGEYGVRLRDFDVYSDRIDYRRIVLKAGNRSYNFRGSIAKGSDEEASPYQIIRAYITYMRSLEGTTAETKLFVRSNSLGLAMRDPKTKELKAMGAASLDAKLKEWAFSAGVPRDMLKQISGHSLRIGLAVDQVERGRSYEYISKITGQTHKTVERYAQQAEMTPFDITEAPGTAG